MQQKTDVKARIVLIVWNLMLTVAVIAMSFRLATVGAEANAALQKVDLYADVIVELGEKVESLAEISESQSVMIADLFMYVSGLQELALANNQAVINVDKNVTNGIAEIYQGHIIPLRSFHMENFNDPD